MFGAEPQADYEAITRRHFGRRINRVEPLKSLVLQKAGGTVPHGGGAKIAANSPELHVAGRMDRAGRALGRRQAAPRRCP